MKNVIATLAFALLTISMSVCQEAPSAQSPLSAEEMDQPQAPSSTSSVAGDGDRAAADCNKWSYYLKETYLNPGAVAAPAFRAALRMANPPGRGATRYPLEWRQGAEGFGRNYGDAIAERVSFQTARFVTGVVTREDPHYVPSGSHNVLLRSVHAISFAFVDRSDSGHRMPAISNFVGAAAGGFVGNAYLPAGFNDLTHAAQRSEVRFGLFAASNLFREFAPQMPRPLRTFFMLVAR